VILRVRLDASSGSRCGRAGDSPGHVTDSDADPATAEAQTSLAEAEEELSRAEARAEAARARAAELRRQAEAGPSDESDDESDTADNDADADETEPAATRSRRWWPWRLRRPGRKAVGIATAAVLIAASLVATGFMAWQHFALVREHRHAVEFAAAARRGVEMMMSIDPDHAKENVQHTIDATTGALKSQLEATSTYMVKSAQDAKVTTKATVEGVAVESMTDNSAVVLLVAKSDTTNPDKSKRPPVFWRLSVNIDRDGGQLKMSKLDFVQ
jgi:Mce-associated membrane protein